jgi:DNA-binding transcriptional MerR regulator
MRIGEVASRAGINAATLRAWERRHGFLHPDRTAGRQRVYDEEDLARVRAVVALTESGVAVSEAIRRATTSVTDDRAAAGELGTRLWDAIDEFDERATVAALATATTTLGIPAALDDVFVPVLRRVGAEWRQSPRNVAREHFASNLLRAHLVRMLPTEASGTACLAFCPEGELHDIGLLMAALTLSARDRPQVVLGANTPSASVQLLLNELRPSIVLVGAATRRAALRFLSSWRRPARCTTVAGGAGFRPEDSSRLGGTVHVGPYASLPDIVGPPPRRR